jgi:hypothetical protein
LQLHYNELEREMHVARKSGATIPKVEQEKAELIRLLEAKKKEAKKLSRELGMGVFFVCNIVESPQNTERWRSLQGSDPSAEQLQQKIAQLEEKLNACQVLQTIV